MPELIFGPGQILFEPVELFSTLLESRRTRVPHSFGRVVTGRQGRHRRPILLVTGDPCRQAGDLVGQRVGCQVAQVVLDRLRRLSQRSSARPRCVPSRPRGLGQVVDTALLASRLNGCTGFGKPVGQLLGLRPCVDDHTDETGNDHVGGPIDHELAVGSGGERIDLTVDLHVNVGDRCAR